MPLSPQEVALACMAIAIGSFVQGIVGFGMALIAGPVLVLLDPSLVPGPLIVAGIAVTSTVAIRERHNTDFNGVYFGLPGLVAGSIVGAILLTSAPLDRLPLVLGILVLVAIGLSVAGLRVEPRPRNIAMTTILAGFMSTTASIPGPPLALLYQHSAAGRLRGTLASLLLTSNVVSIVTLYVAGRFGVAEMQLGAILVPASLMGLFLSRWSFIHVPASQMRVAVLVVAGLSGVTALVRGLG